MSTPTSYGVGLIGTTAFGQRLATLELVEAFGAPNRPGLLYDDSGNDGHGNPTIGYGFNLKVGNSRTAEGRILPVVDIGSAGFSKLSTQRVPCDPRPTRVVPSVALHLDVSRLTSRDRCSGFLGPHAAGNPILH